MSVKILGLEDICEKLDKLVADSNVKEALQEACNVVEASARVKAPKGDGDLRRSITNKVDGDKGVVYTPLEYAPYVEYGTGLFAEKGGRQDVPWCYEDDEGNWHSTSGRKPTPFLRPALYENRTEILRIFGESLKNGK